MSCNNKTSPTSTHNEEVGEELFQTHIGGSALIEGVMMRGKSNWAVAVREPSGDIYTESHELEKVDENSWKRKPIIRGWFALLDSIKLSMKAMDVSAEHAFEYDDEEEKKQDTSKVVSVLGIIIGVVLALVIFNIFPSWLTNITVGDYAKSPFLWNTVQNILKIILFVFYVVLIARMSEIKRMFAYHGAEHKSIHCYEHGLELIPKNAKLFSRFHVRCGTAFIVMTAILSIIVFTVLPLDNLLEASGLQDENLRLALVIVMRIALIPLVAGITYELTVVWAGKNPENPIVKALIYPGLLMQRLTTSEPDEGMLECAIEAMKLVIAFEKQEEDAKACSSNIIRPSLGLDEGATSEGEYAAHDITQ